MIFIPRSLVTLFTFPGVVVHEISHRLIADLNDIPVYYVKYFQMADPSGYVVHGEPKTLKTALLLSIGPLLLNTFCCVILAFPYSMAKFNLDSADMNFMVILMGWLGISIGMHAFPSQQDMQSFIEFVQKNRPSNIFIKIFAKSIAFIFNFANALRVFWFDMFYALGVASILPLILI